MLLSIDMQVSWSLHYQRQLGYKRRFVAADHFSCQRHADKGTSVRYAGAQVKRLE